MNVEYLPRLLDDPQLQTSSNLPSLPGVHIAPLRIHDLPRHAKGPLLLEPLTAPAEDRHHDPRNTGQLEEEQEKIHPPRLSPRDVLSAREGKKPHLAISELLEANDGVDTQNLQLPSFVSLAVVEKSPIPEPTRLNPSKRLRLDLDTDTSSRGVGRRLPRPAQKDDKQTRPVPLLPAMVTGLHEPPPSAGILPSMDVDVRPEPARVAAAAAAAASSKMQVKDILSESKQVSTRLPPEAMLNTPDLPTAELPKPLIEDGQLTDITNAAQLNDSLLVLPKKDQKTRRARRKWSDQETADLVAGVKKHGFGKWKQILVDTAYVFHDRTSIDLKDRYRVYSKDQGDMQERSAPLPHQPQLPPPESTFHDADNDTAKETLTEPPADAAEATKGKRKRRPWTPIEDAALIQGVTKYGFQWTTIHDDAELNLRHRRATDLRDRIRNLYPEGYKQAEVRPLKSEVKKAERISRDQEASPSSNSNIGDKASAHADRSTIATPRALMSESKTDAESKWRSGGWEKSRKRGIEVHQLAEHTGVTLPSLALDGDGELDWGDNTLPPLLEWEDIGM